jgi:ribosomal protein L11 methyltransferase
MNYLKTVFTLTAEDDTSLQAARDLLADELGNYGYEAFEETPDGQLVGYIQQDTYHEAVVNEVIKNRLISDVAITYSTEKIENQDWNAAWEEEGFEPIVVKNMITIYDARHTTDSTLFSTPVSIGIHATNAFGTGTHETTRMMVETLLELPLNGKRILDCGCGTGILGIAALKCGAKHVVSYDIDEWSAENTRYNAELNGVGHQMDILHGDVHILTHVEGIFDVIVANINRNILLDDMEHFHNVLAKGGTLAISGFYEDDAPLLLEKAQTLGLNEVRRKTDNNWCTLIFQTACVL